MKKKVIITVSIIVLAIFQSKLLLLVFSVAMAMAAIFL